MNLTVLFFIKTFFRLLTPTINLSMNESTVFYASTLKYSLITHDKYMKCVSIRNVCQYEVCKLLLFRRTDLQEKIRQTTKKIINV